MDQQKETYPVILAKESTFTDEEILGEHNISITETLRGARQLQSAKLA